MLRRQHSARTLGVAFVVLVTAGLDPGIRVVTQAFDLAALGTMALTGVSTWGRAGPVASTAIGLFR